MTEEQQLKVQAFLDGELPDKDAREVAGWVARDSEATALLNELRNTRKALKDSEPGLRVPESREFYWSKIQREIERLEPALQTPPAISPFSWIRRMIVPVSSAAALALVLTVTLLRTGVFTTAHAPDTEVAQADSNTFTYEDYANGTTLVWLDYPAER